MMPELADRRVLGAVRFLDATTLAKVTSGLRVESEQAVLRPNISGLWVIWDADGLHAHTSAFEQPPASPAAGSILIRLTVADRDFRYLARGAGLRLPRDASLANADAPTSLFRPMDVPLYPAATAPVSPGWALIRARVKNAVSGQPLAGALIRVLAASDQRVLARGMSDPRGEALVTVPGIPITTFSVANGPPLTTEVDVRVQAIFDPAGTAIPDPDAIEAAAGLPSASSTQKLAARRQLTLELAIVVP
jgi:hypothetical protein